MKSFDSIMIQIASGTPGKYVLYEEAQQELKNLQDKLDAWKEVICRADSYMSLLWYRGKPDDLGVRLEIEKTLADLRRIADEQQGNNS